MQINKGQGNTPTLQQKTKIIRDNYKDITSNKMQQLFAKYLCISKMEHEPNIEHELGGQLKFEVTEINKTKNTAIRPKLFCELEENILVETILTCGKELDVNKKEIPRLAKEILRQEGANRNKPKKYSFQTKGKQPYQTQEQTVKKLLENPGLMKKYGIDINIEEEMKEDSDLRDELPYRLAQEIEEKVLGKKSKHLLSRVYQVMMELGWEVGKPIFGTVEEMRVVIELIRTHEDDYVGRGGAHWLANDLIEKYKNVEAMFNYKELSLAKKLRAMHQERKIGDLGWGNRPPKLQ